MTEIEVYVGSLIEHGSDRAVFKRMFELLSAKKSPAVVLANLNLGGREIDLVVALDVTDIGMLRGLSNDAQLGRRAIRAIERLEHRPPSPPAPKHPLLE